MYYAGWTLQCLHLHLSTVFVQLNELESVEDSAVPQIQHKDDISMMQLECSNHVIPWDRTGQKEGIDGGMKTFTHPETVNYLKTQGNSVTLLFILLFLILSLISYEMDSELVVTHMSDYAEFKVQLCTTFSQFCQTHDSTVCWKPFQCPLARPWLAIFSPCVILSPMTIRSLTLSRRKVHQRGRLLPGSQVPAAS